MKLRMLKLSNNGPMIMAKKKDQEDEWFVAEWYNPVVVYEEDSKYHLGSFIDVADPHFPFEFNNVEFECSPGPELIQAYEEFMSDYFPEIQ